jgi:hypothetical protein
VVGFEAVVEAEQAARDALAIRSRGSDIFALRRRAVPPHIVEPHAHPCIVMHKCYSLDIIELIDDKV